MRGRGEGKDRGGETAEVTEGSDSGCRCSRERGERQRKRDEIVIREVQRGDREGRGAADRREGEVQLTDSFVGRRGWREREVEGVKEKRTEDFRVKQSRSSSDLKGPSLCDSRDPPVRPRPLPRSPSGASLSPCLSTLALSSPSGPARGRALHARSSSVLTDWGQQAEASEPWAARELHLYVVSKSSLIFLHLKNSWNNYIITVKLFSQLTCELFQEDSTLEETYALVQELKKAAQRNFMLKRLFWKSNDLFPFLIKKLSDYLPKSHNVPGQLDWGHQGDTFVDAVTPGSSLGNIAYCTSAAYCINDPYCTSAAYCINDPYCTSAAYCINDPYCTSAAYCINDPYCTSAAYCINDPYCTSAAYCINDPYCTSAAYCINDPYCTSAAYCINDPYCTSAAYCINDPYCTSAAYCINDPYCTSAAYCINDPYCTSAAYCINDPYCTSAAYCINDPYCTSAAYCINDPYCTSAAYCINDPYCTSAAYCINDPYCTSAAYCINDPYCTSAKNNFIDIIIIFW
ncbi:UNVERIFIED_CONTAM: hypothetical protein FKN15_060448 [Acipenser sinensis]